MSIRNDWERLGDLMLAAGLALCAIAMMLVFVHPAHADGTNQQAPGAQATDPWLGGNWQLGGLATVNSNPYRGADDADLGGLPLIAYDAERLHIGTDGLSVGLWRNQFATLSLIGDLRMKPFDPDDSSYLRGMEERDMAFDAGLGLSTRIWRGSLDAKFVADASGAYDGYEADLSYKLPTHWGAVRFEWQAGVTWQSDDLVDYMAGVRPGEARLGRPAYAPDDALIPHLDLGIMYPLNEQWVVIAKTGIDFLPDSYTDSPIIDDDFTLRTALGVVYNF